MKKFGGLVAALMLSLSGLVAIASPASAEVKTPGPWELWTKEACQSLAPKPVLWKRLQEKSGSGAVQGRLYVYQSKKWVCAYVVDRLPGAHEMHLYATADFNDGTGWSARDTGTYDQYAGALAYRVPKNWPLKLDFRFSAFLRVGHTGYGRDWTFG